MKQDFNNLRWGVVAGLAVMAASGLFAACNSHPVEFAQATGAISVHEDRSPDSAAAVDILWVIDNSGSMCQEQAALRKNFRNFIDQITTRNIDFHLGVTTTQMDSYALEPVAIPGHLQSTPQPLPTRLPECSGDAGDPNDPTDGYQRIRDAIQLAVDCTKDPAKWESLVNVTDEEIACEATLAGRPDDCACEADDPASCHREDLFPTYNGSESPYRDIPKVLKFSDYNQGGTLDHAQLEKDFSCMSFVGVSGNSVEKGLSAAVEAVSPELTGGTVENPTDANAPNHGFLRDSAKFSVIFVTDETDCSHDGTLSTRNHCGDDACAFANMPGLEDSPLIPSETLAQNMRDNLSGSKGYDVNLDSIIAASIHGRWKRYGATADYPTGQPVSLSECPDLTEPPSASVAEQTSCDTSFGTAYSGDRYERFLRQFKAEQVFPKIPDDPNDHMTGLICRPNEIAGTLEGIGKTIAGSVSQCIFNVPYACSSSDQCPGYAFGEGAPECRSFGQSGESYCSSGIQLRMYPGEGDEVSFADLQNHEYCIPESIDSTMTPGGCVIKRDKYSFTPCAGAETEGINLSWSDSRYFNSLSGYDVELVYTILPEGSDSSANNGAANNGSGAQ